MSRLRTSTNISNELGMIGEKVAKDWLRQHGHTILPTWGVWEDSEEFRSVKEEYELHFDEKGKLKDEYKNNFALALSGLEWRINRCKEEIEQTKKLFGEEEQKRLKALMKDADKVRRALSPKPRIGLHGLHDSAVYPDILARTPELTFIEAKVNSSRVERGQKAFLDLARKHGFATKIIRVSVHITTDVSMTDY